MTNHTNARFMVWHLMDEFFRDAYTKVDTQLSHYTPVATVEADCYQQVFQLTNHGVPGEVDNWTDGPAVLDLFTPKNRTRSTSVGDLVSDETGAFYRVMGAGWELVVMNEHA